MFTLNMCRIRHLYEHTRVLCATEDIKSRKTIKKDQFGFKLTFIGLFVISYARVNNTQNYNTNFLSLFSTHKRLRVYVKQLTVMLQFSVSFWLSPACLWFAFECATIFLVFVASFVARDVTDCFSIEFSRMECRRERNANKK